ncbi:hypothetical protein HK097_004779, partial [Rhizophlyctis rosea]
MPSMKHALLLQSLLFTTLSCVSAQTQHILPNDTMPAHPGFAPDDPDTKVQCPGPLQYGIFTEPTGCWLCNKVPINNVDPKYINPIKAGGQNNVPGFPAYSTWAMRDLQALYEADGQPRTGS